MKEDSQMKRQTVLSFALLGTFFAAGQIAPAAADPADSAYQLPPSTVGIQIADKGRGKKHGAGNLFKFKTKNYGPKIKYAGGGPPPWAPAHGYRRKHGGRSAGYQSPFDLNLGSCNRSLLGTVIGGVGGGVLGSQVGSGSGRTVAIVGGTILGAVVGGSIGNTMDSLDQNCVGQALEHAPDGQQIKWNSPTDNAEYRVTPIDSYQRTDGRYCREYRTNATIGGKPQEVYGTSCRQPDGSWELVS